jgi:CrcB protein
MTRERGPGGPDRDLPVDPDAGAEPNPTAASHQVGRPVHLRWSSIAVVAVGGAVGTAARALITAAIPAGAFSWPILAINLVGAFCLGLLLDVLAHRGPDEGRRRTARLLLGTGVLGGFTTYSTLAVDTATLLQAGHVGAGVGYGLGTVVAGLGAVAAGLVVASALRPRGRTGSAVGGADS